MGITRKRKDKQIFFCVCGDVYFIALLNEIIKNDFTCGCVYSKYYTLEI